MRITHNMIHSNVLRDIMGNFERAAKLHEQGSSGLKIRYPSDDAIVATRASNINSRLRELQQYQRNINTVESTLKAYDSTVLEMSALTYRVRELMVQGANDTLTPDDRKTIAMEIDRIRDHMIQLANTQVAGNHIFGGARADQAPVTMDGVIRMDPAADRKLTTDLGGYPFAYNITVYEVFTVSGNESIFNLLENQSANLKADNPDFYLNDIALEKMDRFELQIQQMISHNGASQNFLEMAKNRYSEFEQFMTEYLSKEQDADFLEVYTKLTMADTALQAALKTGASIMLPTLVDFMR